MDAPIPPDVMRHALFDPAVPKRRILARLPGYRIDADDLHAAVQEHLPKANIAPADVDAAVRQLGGDRIKPGPLVTIKRLLGQDPSHRSVYWMSMVSYRLATRRNP